MIEKKNHKEKTLVWVVCYSDKILGVAPSLTKARAFAKRHVIKDGYSIDQFEFFDTPLI